MKYLLKRTLTLFPVFLIAATAVFFMIRFAPGGPFDADRKIPDEILRQLESKYHLDEPLYMQYFRYMKDLASFDLGPSFKHINMTVNEILAQSLPVSAELGLWSLLVALFIGLGSGIIASFRPNTFLDYLPMSFSVLGICLPTFVIGPLSILLFGIYFEWLPVAGWETWQDRILPSLTLGFAYAAYISRLTRGGMMEMRSQDFVRTARAKGLSQPQVLVKHCLKGGLLPVVSYLGPAVAGLMTGALVTENIFNIPGLGRFFIQGALNRDYTLVMGTALLYFTLVFVCNLLVDLMYALLDPRVKYES